MAGIYEAAAKAGAHNEALTWMDYERSVIQRALKLAEGQPPEANLAPFIDIVKVADRLGLVITRL